MPLDPFIRREVSDDLRLMVPLATVCEHVGLHPVTGRNYARQGTFPLPVVKVGTRYYCTRKDLLTYLGVDSAPDRNSQPNPKSTLTTTEQAALERLKDLGPNIVPAARDVRTILAAVTRLAG